MHQEAEEVEFEQEPEADPILKELQLDFDLLDLGIAREINQMAANKKFGALAAHSQSQKTKNIIDGYVFGPDLAKIIKDSGRFNRLSPSLAGSDNQQVYPKKNNFRKRIVGSLQIRSTQTATTQNQI